MALASALFMVAGFVLVLGRLRLAEKSGEVIAETRAAAREFSNPDWDDRAKELALQRRGRRLFVLFAQLASGLACALLAPAAIVWLASRSGVVSFAAVTDVLVSWEFVLGTTAGACGLAVLLRRRRV